jgi:TfoX/Sxy family transcriptional regulator of competence genes
MVQQTVPFVAKQRSRPTLPLLVPSGRLRRRSRDARKSRRAEAPGRVPSLGDDDPGVAYDEDLANRIRELIASEPDVSEETMFGGLVFLVGGKMSVAASGTGDLIVRVDPEETDVLLAKPHAQPFEMRGRAMQGRLRIDAEGVRTKRQLEPWVRRGVAYARSLPSER